MLARVLSGSILLRVPEVLDAEGELRDALGDVALLENYLCILCSENVLLIARLAIY